MIVRLPAPGRSNNISACRAERRPRREDMANERLETGRNRLVMAGFVFALCFAGLAARLVDVALVQQTGTPTLARKTPAANPHSRAVIRDRNGVILATTLRTYSLYADAKLVPNRREAARKLTAALPGLDRTRIEARLATLRRFTWLKRHLTPAQYQAVNSLGIPGIYVRSDARRVYPHGRLAGHILGFTDVDNRGLAGVERQFDARLGREYRAVTLSIDVRLQHILRGEMAAAIKRYNAKAGAALMLDARTGEVLSMVSLPDFDPNHAAAAPTGSRFNRNTLGVYEMGSTFKILNTALALESGTTRLTDRLDARRPIEVASFKIRDYTPMNRFLSVDDVLVHSSNIGSAKMALRFGGVRQKAFMKRMGLLQPAGIELPEVGVPLSPRTWRPINTMTISYGHGIAVSPVQFGAAIAATVNGGELIAPTLVKRAADRKPAAKRVLSRETSNQIRYLMRQVVVRGTGKRAAVPGYLIGGKTGSADKSTRGGGLLSSFVGAFPMNDPRYVLLVLLDEPKGNKATRYKGTGGLVAAPTFAQIVGRVAPLLGVIPIDEAALDRQWQRLRLGPGVPRLASIRTDGQVR